MICILVAHYAEAKAIITQYQLTRRSSNVYCNDFLYVLITGQGSQQTAKTLANHWQFIQKADIFVNYGLAGHASYALGQRVVIRSLQYDAEMIALLPMSNSTANSTANSKANCAANCIEKCFKAWSNEYGALRSVAALEDYSGDFVQDMELVAIYAFLLKQAKADKLMSIKIISDNKAQPIATLDKKKIVSLLDDAWPKLSQLISCLCSV